MALVELSLDATEAMDRPAVPAPHPVVRIGDYVIIPSAAAERQATGELVWYGSAVARRVSGGESFEGAFDYYQVACVTEQDALTFAVQRTSERLCVTFGLGDQFW